MITIDIPIPISIKAQVFDEFKNPHPLANIAIDGKPVATTDNNGFFNIPNVSNKSIVTISYVGLKPVQYPAFQLPKQIFMEVSRDQLPGVTIVNQFKKSNWLLWMGVVGLGIAAFAGKKTIQYKRAKL